MYKISEQLKELSLTLKLQNKIEFTNVLGLSFTSKYIICRIFAPDAYLVSICIFDHPEQKFYEEILMDETYDSIWETTISQSYIGKYYNFMIYKSSEEYHNKAGKLVLDPYAKHITKKNTYLTPAKGIIKQADPFDWGNDKNVSIAHKDLIIYECHLRDTTAHPSSNAKKPGTYESFIEIGIPYLKKLGINAVEFLPIHSFTNYEIPYYQDLPDFHITNTWNPYERNHWGYMTINYFTPESYYYDADLEFNKWTNLKGEANNAFKEVVKQLHKNNIAVIMDVVYNHYAQYFNNGLKQICEDYYFRKNYEGYLTSDSGCGNDLKSENAYVRKLIIESLIYWLKEYHIDGFRFDLAKLLDWETIEEIEEELRNIYPDVILIAEPWMGGYDPSGFSYRNWAAWNDQIRNGIKGENPFSGKGWIFGHWYHFNYPNKIKNYLSGTIIDCTVDRAGLFLTPEHSVNYLESHDGYTLGDFIRLAIGKASTNFEITNIDEFIKLNSYEITLHKLAAAFLFASSGIIMIHQGQEFARSKVIDPNSPCNDSHKGLIDHDSYNKDNNTNYINYKHIEINSELFEFYQNLIKIRNSYPSIKSINHQSFEYFEQHENPFFIGIKKIHKKQEFIALFNSSDEKITEISIENNNWDILIQNNCYTNKNENYTNIKLEPKSFIYLIRENK